MTDPSQTAATLKFDDQLEISVSLLQSLETDFQSLQDLTKVSTRGQPKAFEEVSSLEEVAAVKAELSLGGLCLFKCKSPLLLGSNPTMEAVLQNCGYRNEDMLMVENLVDRHALYYSDETFTASPTTVKAFLQEVASLAAPVQVLDDPSGIPTSWSMYSFYFEDDCGAWARPIADGAHKPALLRADHVTLRQWATMHSAGCWSNVSHHGGGLCTSHQLLTGSQVFFWWPLNAQTLAAEQLQDLAQAIHEYQWDALSGWQFVVVEAPDMLIIPPGTLWASYSLSPTVISGRHWLAKNTMLATELSRHLDYLVNSSTDADHDSVFRSICRIAMFLDLAEGIGPLWQSLARQIFAKHLYGTRLERDCEADGLGSKIENKVFVITNVKIVPVDGLDSVDAEEEDDLLCAKRHLLHISGTLHKIKNGRSITLKGPVWYGGSSKSGRQKQK